MKIPDEKDVFVSEFVSNSVFQEWLYVFTIQLGIRASPAVTHYTSWMSSAMDETLKKPSRVFARGLGNAVPISSTMSPEVLIRVLCVDLKDPRRKKEGNLYAGDRGHFYSRPTGHTYHRCRYPDHHSGGIEDLHIFNYI